MYRVIQSFHDAKSFELMQIGAIIDWTDAERIRSAVERGLIEEVKPEKKAEPKKATKKTATKKK